MAFFFTTKQMQEHMANVKPVPGAKMQGSFGEINSHEELHDTGENNSSSLNFNLVSLNVFFNFYPRLQAGNK